LDNKVLILLMHGATLKFISAHVRRWTRAGISYRHHWKEISVEISSMQF